ncbi:MAG: hypothetical protein EAZ42_03605 [Verrucomicrobia bacterium]|nr:MAG: hypothetical protein EAZ42_03605 [Verrucomicrobiota bacterium]
MKLICLLLTAFFWIGMIVDQAQASPEKTSRIKEAYQQAMTAWIERMRGAKDQEQRTAIEATRPDPAKAARSIWAQILPDLNQSWTIAPASWFLQVTQPLTSEDQTGIKRPLFGKETDAIFQAFESHHLASKQISDSFPALVALRDPRALELLKKIQEKHPDQKVQGVAALAAAIKLKELGDGPDLMKLRLQYLRKAVIQSSEEKLDGMPVSQLAEDELYIIRFLTKGRVAPDLTGMDAENQALKLSDYLGKVIVLVFWSADDAESARLVEMTADLAEKMKGKPVVVLGVNPDPLDRLRALQADGRVTWRNFSDAERALSKQFRIGQSPLVYVLDQQRKVHYTGLPGSFVEMIASGLVDQQPAQENPSKPEN